MKVLRTYTDEGGVMDAPNPGSPEAQDKGCKCAVIDNNRGQYPPWPPDGWWINGACPMHAMGEEE